MHTKSIKMRDIHGWGPYLRQEWERNFAGHLSENEKKSIHLSSFLWHVCSFNKVKCLEKDAAIQAFHHQNKKKCTLFYENIDEAYLIDNAVTLKAEDLPYDRLHMYYGDIYVMDWDGNWSFVMTHESMCGPYFIKK